MPLVPHKGLGFEEKAYKSERKEAINLIKQGNRKRAEMGQKMVPTRPRAPTQLSRTGVPT